ncbi:uncharacterized protein [Branchiostoma lanceolatum]|uniref:uncharacterized protein n=1 Tax=Branchiostoma lanceolatum TaxID=7740 RepID=UPI003453DF6F
MSSPSENQPSINSSGSHMAVDYTNMGAELSTESQDDRPFREMMIASDLSESVDDPDITIIRDYTSSMSSAVKVEITDANDAEFNYSTSAALRKCKKQVLQPYGRLLALIGWRALGREAISNHLGWKVLNVLYTIFILFLLIFSYIFQVLVCQGRLNIHTDVKAPTETPATVVPETSSKTLPYINETDMFTAQTIIAGTTNATDIDAYAQPAQCSHVFTTYVVPDILHFMAYLLGFFYFRIQDNEQLYALMEKVFLKASVAQSRNVSRAKMIQMSRIYLITGALWVVLSLAVQGVFVAAFGVEKMTFLGTTVQWKGWHIMLICLQMLGVLVTNAVNYAVVVNYTTQCEMIIYYMKGIFRRLQEKSTDLKLAMHDILDAGKSISQLNGQIAKMTSLCAVNFAELSIIGLVILFLNQFHSVLIWVYRGTFPILWLGILIVPLVQAARLNSTIMSLKRIGLDMRVFGYQNSSQLERDSFLLFLLNLNFKAKLFHIPIKPSYLFGILVLVTFTLLLLLQTSVIGGSSIFL